MRSDLFVSFRLKGIFAGGGGGVWTFCLFQVQLLLLDVCSFVCLFVWGEDGI